MLIVQLKLNLLFHVIILVAVKPVLKAMLVIFILEFVKVSEIILLNYGLRISNKTRRTEMVFLNQIEIYTDDLVKHKHDNNKRLFLKNKQNKC